MKRALSTVTLMLLVAASTANAQTEGVMLADVAQVVGRVKDQPEVSHRGMDFIQALLCLSQRSGSSPAVR